MWWRSSCSRECWFFLGVRKKTFWEAHHLHYKGEKNVTQVFGIDRDRSIFGTITAIDIVVDILAYAYEQIPIVLHATV